jgi:hypothetical protein
MVHGPEHYLDKDAAAGRVMAHARLLLKLTRRFESIAPSGLRYSARVANFKSGKIVIHAENGAVAAKLRQMSGRLCDELSKGGPQCSAVEVKVQPRQTLFQSSTSTPKPLSKHALGALQSTCESLPAGPLRDALSRLIDRSESK